MIFMETKDDIVGQSFGRGCREESFDFGDDVERKLTGFHGRFDVRRK